MDEKVKVTDTEQTDKKVNEDTTLKEKLVEAECMEADMPEQSEEQDGTGAEETTSYLPLAADQLDLAKQYKQMMLFYEAGIRQLTTKLQILNREFEQSNDRNPIENIKSRIKSAESIAKKMKRKGLPMTLSCLTNNIYDIAGIRVICPFITDVYEVARMLLSQTDVELVQVKDYIREPKENGYRSLHLIVKINVFFSDGMRQVPVATDSLSTKANPILYIRTSISTPYTYMRYKAVNKGDEDKISQALQKLMMEDLTLKAVNDSENGQTLLYGMGDQHLEVAVSKLLNRYKVEVELKKPKIAFRETIRKKADVEYKYKKQSGGHGQYGHVKMTFEPSGDLEQPYVFEQTVVGGAVPKNYFPAVEKGLQESVVKGPLAGYPVVGVKATLYDGSYHPVDSSEMAFKTATIQAFKKGFMEASPVLLEPIVSVKVTVPDEYTGDVMGDLNKRRGRVLGMTPVGAGNQIVEADVPMTGLFGYCTTLRSMTGGRGTYEYTFARYEQAPSEVQEAEIAKRAAEE